MDREHMPTPERMSELPHEVFGLEKMSADQVAALIEAVAAANDAADDSKDATHPGLNDVEGILCGDLKRLAEQSPEKAYDLFLSLTQRSSTWAKAYAMDQLAESLLKQVRDQPEKLQVLIDRWVSLLNDQEEFVRQTASETLFLVEGDAWPDEPTAWYIAGEIEQAREREYTRLDDQ